MVKINIVCEIKTKECSKEIVVAKLKNNFNYDGLGVLNQEESEIRYNYYFLDGVQYRHSTISNGYRFIFKINVVGKMFSLYYLIFHVFYIFINI